MDQTDEVWRQKLTPEQYHVLREKATEAPYTGKLLYNDKQGSYVCAACGNVLFASDTKFDAHCGWPSFTKPIERENAVEQRDTSHGMIRTEVRSRAGDSHLGHVFPDGPREKGGLRYCINSASLRFIPVDQLESEGYTSYRPLFETSKEGVRK